MVPLVGFGLAAAASPWLGVAAVGGGVVALAAAVPGAALGFVRPVPSSALVSFSLLCLWWLALCSGGGVVVGAARLLRVGGCACGGVAAVGRGAVVLGGVLLAPPKTAAMGSRSGPRPPFKKRSCFT